MNLVLVLIGGLVIQGSLVLPSSAEEGQNSVQLSRVPAGMPGYMDQLGPVVPGNRLPVYKPPQNAAPAERLDGLNRGEVESRPELRVLLPHHHVGQTGSKQPILYWFISQPTSSPIIFTLVDSRQVVPIVEDHLPPPHPGGIHPLPLSEYGVTLEPEVRYNWFVTLPSGDPAIPSSRDIVAGGAVEYVGYIKKVMIYDPCTRDQNVFGLAECGLWYDALEEISAKIAESPHDQALRLQRAALLEQEGLREVAEFDIGALEKP